MPTNPNAPFGFRKIKGNDGLLTSYGTRRGLVVKTSTTAIFAGDPVSVQQSGYYQQASVTNTNIGGIASGFSWISTTQNKRVWSKYWPGSATEASADIEIDIDVDGIFEVQCLTGPITQAQVGQYACFNVGSGGQTVGAGNLSSYTLADATLTTVIANTPFELYGLPVPGGLAALYSTPGYDVTNAFNRVWVRLANLTL